MTSSVGPPSPQHDPRIDHDHLSKNSIRLFQVADSMGRGIMLIFPVYFCEHQTLKQRNNRKVGRCFDVVLARNIGEAVDQRFVPKIGTLRRQACSKNRTRAVAQLFRDVQQTFIMLCIQYTAPTVAWS